MNKMTKRIALILASSALAATLLIPASAFGYQAAAKTTKAAKATKAAAAPVAPPTAKDIADAKAKGLVWVNTNTKVYHKDGANYGTTKQGKFMTEADAQKAGYRAAIEPVAGKKSTKK
jgi:hypothetical protein